MAKQTAILPMATASPSFPPADALLALPWRRWVAVVRWFILATAAAIVATWRHHRMGDRLATAAAIGAAFLAIGAAWLWESGRPAAIRWLRKTAWPVARRLAAETVLAIRAIAQPPLTV